MFNYIPLCDLGEELISEGHRGLPQGQRRQAPAEGRSRQGYDKVTTRSPQGQAKVSSEEPIRVTIVSCVYILW